MRLRAQAESAPGLPAEQFELAERAVMDLIAASRDARLSCCERLLADVDDRRPTR